MPKFALSDNAHLHIFKASAGSGKTHRLTAEYLKLLFASPFAYRHVLAVTFTNKATDEMKSRIIGELAHLAKGEDSDYLLQLARQFKLTQEQVQQKAYNTLVNILHDYSSFSVSTIDRFFQQTMRAFTREIGLGGGYNVELDTGKVLGEAIDSMLFDLEKKDNRQLLDWLIRFSEEKVENGETWNIRKDIMSLSSELFKESYKTHSSQVQANIADKTLMDEYKKMLFAYIRHFQQRSQQIAEKALNIIARFELSPEDFKGSSRSPFKSFIKWANGEIFQPTPVFRLLADDMSNWYTAKTPSDLKGKIEKAYISGLNASVCEIISIYDNASDYNTASEINRYFFALGILGDIDKKVREYTAENNVMLIADTTELLNKIIQGNDTPFIYEKVGLRIDNYMIDEFQDTSRMQWENFRPLIHNSLAVGTENFIVGDVKQSIYRWRNSDWKLLDKQLYLDFGDKNINSETLETNWRSAYNIIDFNNAIFCKSATILQDLYNRALPENYTEKGLDLFSTRIQKAYAEVYQQVPACHLDNAGRVHINFVDTNEYDWQEYALEQLPLQIKQLQNRGYKLKDIAILVRKKDEGVRISNCLLEYKSKHPESPYRYDIISDEALYITNSKSVKLIISLLNYIQNPGDNSLKGLAVYEYFKYNDQLEPADALHKYFSGNGDLPSEISIGLSRIKELPLYEMIEEILKLFQKSIEKEEQVYIQSFLDMVLDFSTKQSPDLNTFLKWWNETGIKKTILTPDGQDAIRIMTIHKSKGLGFKVVLIPFCNWELDHRLTTILWCQPRKEPFNKLHLVPVKYSEKLKNTIFEYEYFDEKLHAFVDNLNVLYVAFTRAKCELIAYAPKYEREDVKNIASLLWACIDKPLPIAEADNNEREFIDLEEAIDKKTGLFELGGDYLAKPSKERSSTEEIEIDNLPGIMFDNRLKLLLNNKYFFTDMGQRDYGTLMHEIISKVQTLDDLGSAVDDFYLSGDTDAEQKDQIFKLLSDYLSKEPVAKWYDGTYTILNEIQILLPNGSIVRPDRVMIKGQDAIVVDYKFGLKENKKYIQQVKLYADYIRKIGYQNVKSYIYYVLLDKIVEC